MCEGDLPVWETHAEYRSLSGEQRAFLQGAICDIETDFRLKEIDLNEAEVSTSLDNKGRLLSIFVLTSERNGIRINSDLTPGMDRFTVGKVEEGQVKGESTYRRDGKMNIDAAYESCRLIWMKVSGMVGATIYDLECYDVRSRGPLMLVDLDQLLEKVGGYGFVSVTLAEELTKARVLGIAVEEESNRIWILDGFTPLAYVNTSWVTARSVTITKVNGVRTGCRRDDPLLTALNALDKTRRA